MELTCMHATGDMVTRYIDRFSHTQWGVCDGTGCMGNSYLTVTAPGFLHMSPNCLGPLIQGHQVHFNSTFYGKR